MDFHLFVWIFSLSFRSKHGQNLGISSTYPIFRTFFANVSWFQAYLKVFVIHPIGEMKPPGLPVTLQPQVMYHNEGNDSDYTVYVYIYIYQMVK